MKKLFSITLLVTLLSTCMAQDYKKKFAELCAKGDTAGQLNLLKEWETKKATDPEMFVCYFNYYLQKGLMSVIKLGTQTPTGDSFVITNPEDSNNVVGYLGEGTVYKNNEFEKAIDYLDKGITVNPNRLDMYFGKIYVLGENMNYKQQTTEILHVIDQANKNKNKWLWADNLPWKGNEKDFLGSIQGYVNGLFDAEANVDYIKSISEKVLEFHPSHVESLSNMGVVFIKKKDFKKSLDYFSKAESLSPEDYIVLANMAYSYRELGDKKNAKNYYKKVVKYAPDDAKEYAKERLKEL